MAPIVADALDTSNSSTDKNPKYNPKIKATASINNQRNIIDVGILKPINGRAKTNRIFRTPAQKA
jgi:hypothetical protein